MSNNIRLDLQREAKRIARPGTGMIALEVTSIFLAMIAILPDGKLPLIDANLGVTKSDVLFRGALLTLALCLALTGLRILLIALLVIKPIEQPSASELRNLIQLEENDNLVRASGLRFTANILGWASVLVLCAFAVLLIIAIWRILNP